MKIEHITHEATKRGRSTSLPRTAKERVKNYFSSRILGNTELNEDEQPLIRPDPETERRRVPEANTPEMQKKQQHWVPLADDSRIRLKERNNGVNKESGNYRVSKKTGQFKWQGYGPWLVKRSNEDRLYPEPTPPTKTKSDFKNLQGSNRRTEQRNKASGDLYIERRGARREVMREAKLEKVVPPTFCFGQPRLTPDHREHSLEDMRIHRQAMREGKLEKVLPSSSSPSKNPTLTPNPQVPSGGKMRHKKTASTSSVLSSTSSKLSSYMGNGADILDATRRDLTSNLRKSAGKITSKIDNIGHYVASIGSSWDDSDDSDDSFYCIGEDPKRRKGRAGLARRSSELERARRLSSDGTDPWVDSGPKACRLCRKPSPAGIRGLCQKCETKFYRTTIEFADSEMTKPTPTIKVSKARDFSTLAQVTTGVIPNRYTDESLNGLKDSQVGSKPQLATPNIRQSHLVHMESSSTPRRASIFVSKHERWQSPKVRALYQENEDTRWSPSLLGDENSFKPLPSLPQNALGRVRNLSITDKDSSYSDDV